MTESKPGHPPAKSSTHLGRLRTALKEARNLPYAIFGGLLLLSLLCRLLLLLR